MKCETKTAELSIKDSAAKRKNLQSLTSLPSTFGELAQRVLAILPTSERLDFVTDTYRPDSSKALERIHRGLSDTFLLKGANTKVPKEWKTFLANNENKTQLLEPLLPDWSKECYAEKLLGRELYVTSD